MAVDHCLEMADSSCQVDDNGVTRTGNQSIFLFNVSILLRLSDKTQSLALICSENPPNRTIRTAIAHIITAVIGSGMLSFAWSTAQLGWLADPIATFCFAIVTAIQKSNCYHKEGHKAPCEYATYHYMLAFGGVQLVFSQIPDFHNIEWLSIVASVMSFCYSTIGFGLGLAKVIANGTIKGSIGGVPMPTTVQKVWRISQGIGDIAFAYPYSLILLEIQDTLKAPPTENKTMKKASMASILITTFFYLCCGCFGYAAFGKNTPGNLLTGFGFYEPYWLIDFANACIIVHLVGGYQVYSQPLFAFFDRWFSKKFPNSWLINKAYTIKLPGLPPYRLTLFRLSFRTLYVASTTGIAMIFPYFNDVLAILGSLNFWPLAIYFPVEMYLVQRNVIPWTKNWVILQAFSLACLLVSIFSLIGSVQGLVSKRFS